MATFRQVCPGFVNNAPNAIAICTDLDVAPTASAAEAAPKRSAGSTPELLPRT
jgi:hypothetical protein